jgi:hypothetical protein
MLVLDGKIAAAAVKATLLEQTQALKAAGKRMPHLAAILVGNNGASETYVASLPAAGEFTDSTLIYNSNPSASIEEHSISEAMNNLVVSPNPAVDQLQMNWLTQESYESYQLELIDLEGKVLLAIPHMTNNVKVDIKDLQAGVYLVKVKAAHSQATQRIIKL